MNNAAFFTHARSPDMKKRRHTSSRTAVNIKKILLAADVESSWIYLVDKLASFS